MRQILKGEREYSDFNSDWTANKEATLRRRALGRANKPKKEKAAEDAAITGFKIAATKDQAKIAHLTTALAEANRQVEQVREEKDREIAELKKQLAEATKPKKTKKVKMMKSTN
jgi:small-conductance mechanosensitive channel